MSCAEEDRDTGEVTEMGVRGRKRSRDKKEEGERGGWDREERIPYFPKSCSCAFSMSTLWIAART